MGLILLEITGVPVPKARPRTVRSKAGAVHAFTPDATVSQERRVQAAWKEAGSPTIEGPIAVRASFWFYRPPSHYNTKGELNAIGLRAIPGRGDTDNYLKLVTDALNKLAFSDDRLIVDLQAVKGWLANSGVPHTTIQIRPTTI